MAASTLAASLTAGAEATPPQPITAYGFDDGTVHHTVGSAYLTASGTAAVVVTDAERGKVLRVDGTTNGFAAFPQASSTTHQHDGADGREEQEDHRRLLHLRVRRGLDEVLLPQSARRRGTQFDHPELLAERVRRHRHGGEWCLAPLRPGLRRGEDDGVRGRCEARRERPAGHDRGRLGSNLLGYLGKSFYSADASAAATATSADGRTPQEQRAASPEISCR